MKINEMIDQVVMLKQERALLSKQDKELGQQQRDLETAIMQSMFEAGTNRAASDLATVAVRHKPQPAVTDWSAFYEHVANTGNWDLLQRRLSAPAFTDRWKAGEVIPGTTSADVTTLSITISK